MMGGGGLLGILILAALVVVPFWKLLPRFGISKYFALMAVLPAVALILLWVIAFKDDLDGRDA
jgi:hypothetical protein